MSTRTIIRTILDEKYQLSNTLIKKKLNERAIGILSEEDKYSFNTGISQVAPPKPVQKPKRLQDEPKSKLSLKDVLRKPETSKQDKQPVHYVPMKSALKSMPPRWIPPTLPSAEQQAMAIDNSPEGKRKTLIRKLAGLSMAAGATIIGGAAAPVGATFAPLAMSSGAY